MLLILSNPEQVARFEKICDDPVTAGQVIDMQNAARVIRQQRENCALCPKTSCEFREQVLSGELSECPRLNAVRRSDGVSDSDDLG